MTSVEEVIQPFIPMLNRGIPLDDLITPILSENPELVREDVLEALQSHIKPTVTQIKAISKTEKATINTGRYRERMSRREYQKTMTHLQDIINIIIDSPNGVRKSTILKELRKENSHWRPKITRWLHDLLEDGVILSDGIGNGTLYYPPNIQVQNRERKYHRLIAESLQINGDMTMTQLTRRLGCDGGSNRHKVRIAVQDLANEGWIEQTTRNRWAWNL